MSQVHLFVGADVEPAVPAIRRITPADLFDAMARGWDDFAAMPTHALFLCAIYPILGVAIAGLTLGFAIVPLLFPLAAGFALIGPIAAVGLYELSRRREAGVSVWVTDAFDVLRSPSIGAIVALGALLMIIFLVWVATARAIYVANFGYGSPESLGAFAHDVLFTPAGWTLIVIGNAVGFLFAVLVLTIGAVSFPLLLDRNVGAAVALVTSVRGPSSSRATRPAATRRISRPCCCRGSGRIGRRSHSKAPSRAGEPGMTADGASMGVTRCRRLSFQRCWRPFSALRPIVRASARSARWLSS